MKKTEKVIESHGEISVGPERGAEVQMVDQQFHKFETEPAVVSVELGVTLNLGNFESCRITVGLKAPCYVEQVDDAYKTALAWVSECLAEQASEIRNKRGGF